MSRSAIPHSDAVALAILRLVVVHSALPVSPAEALDAELRKQGIAHLAHGDRRPVRAAEVAAADAEALALVGPYRSAEVAEAVEATAPVGLPLLAPVATWAGVTRDDEPGCDDPAQHRGTILRLVARDTEVASRLADAVRAAGQRALVIAGAHAYGRQLDGQLRVADLPRAENSADADLVVLCGLAGEPEIDQAFALAALPIIAFDGVQGSVLDAATDVRLALPFAPIAGLTHAELMEGVAHARHAGVLLANALGTADERPALLAALRALGPFDAHGDLIDPPVWLWRVAPRWELSPDRALAHTT